MTKGELIILIIGIILGVAFFYILNSYLENSNQSLKSLIFMNDSCILSENSSLSDNAYCSKRILKGFYYYNESNVGRRMDFETLKAEGGVCSHYAAWYDDIGKELGYNSEIVRIKMKWRLSHVFTVWSNEETYCILDQLNIDCVEFDVLNNVSTNERLRLEIRK